MPADNSEHLRRCHPPARADAPTGPRSLRRLEADGGPVTLDLVARTAGVSRAWLYTEPAIRDAVQRLGAAHRPTINSPVPAFPARQ
jgi:hypothetical protein